MKRGLALKLAGGLLLITLLYLTYHLTSLNRAGSRFADITGVINTLRQIDGAKQQWSIDQKQQVGAPVTMEQLQGYLNPEHLKSNGVRYVIRPLGELDVAVLTRRFDGWIPEGTTVRLSTNSGHEFGFPNGTIRYPDGRVSIISNAPPPP